MKLSICIPALLFFSACHNNHNANKAIDVYFDREIRDRIGVICAEPDSMRIDPSKIDREVNNLVLMSKDIENLKATISRSNYYFKALAEGQQLDPSDFRHLNPDMELSEMASLLKQNELNFFNQVIFKHKSPGDLPMYTAH